jgi:hypothetical protein
VTDPIDTGNYFLITAQGENVLIMRPPMRPITREQALNMAAFLVAIADPTRERFEQVLTAVCST